MSEENEPISARIKPHRRNSWQAELALLIKELRGLVSDAREVIEMMVEEEKENREAKKR